MIAAEQILPPRVLVLDHRHPYQMIYLALADLGNEKVKLSQVLLYLSV
jgi:hypothetical protein